MRMSVKVSKAEIEAYVLAYTMDTAAENLQHGDTYKSLDDVPHFRDGMKLYKFTGTLEIVE